MGLTGLMGPAGPAGPEGTLPSGSLIFLFKGSPVPAGYDYVGSLDVELYRSPSTSGRPRDFVVNVYRKR
jgi:hypothetical protein